MQAGFARAIDPSFTRDIEVPRVNPPLPATAAHMDAARPTNRFSAGLLLVALALGASVNSFGPKWAQAIFQTVKLDSSGGVSALLVAVAASIVLHEAGHLAAAIAMNFEVLGICLGPLRAIRSYGRWSVESSGKLFTGSVSAVARNIHRWRERVLVVVAGGPAATLVSGLAAGLILFHTPVDGWPKSFLGALTEFNFFLFVLGLVPNGCGAGVRNDARQFLIFWNDTAEAQEIFLYHLMARLELTGVRPRDYPIGVIQAMAAMKGRPESMLIYAQTIGAWALDSGDAVSAQAWDARALELKEACSIGAQAITLAKSACLDVLLRDDLAAAKRKLAQVDLNSLAPVWLQHRTKAIHRLIEQNVEEVLAEASRAQYDFPEGVPYFGFERMLLGELHRKALAIKPRELSIFCTNRAA